MKWRNKKKKRWRWGGGDKKGEKNWRKGAELNSAKLYEQQIKKKKKKMKKIKQVRQEDTMSFQDWREKAQIKIKEAD